MLIKASSAVLAGLLSFAAGALVGVLFAPDAGERTRRRLRRRGEELADRAAAVHDSAAELVERARHRVVA